MVSSAARRRHQPRFVQLPEVLRNCGTGNRKGISDLSDRAGLIPYKLKHCETRGIGQRMEGGIERIFGRRMGNRAVSHK